MKTEELSRELKELHILFDEFDKIWFKNRSKAFLKGTKYREKQEKMPYFVVEKELKKLFKKITQIPWQKLGNHGILKLHRGNGGLNLKTKQRYMILRIFAK